MFVRIIDSGRDLTIECDSVAISRELAKKPNELTIEVKRQGRLSEFYGFDKDNCQLEGSATDCGIWLMNNKGQTIDTVFSTH